MIKKVQVLWYLNKEDLENYCIDFKEYKSHKLEGYEICDVDEDLIYDLCDRDPDRLEPIGYFKNAKEIENYLSDTITNNEFDLDLDSPELKEKINTACSNLAAAISWLSPFSKTQDFRYGVFSIAPLVFCISMALVFLFLTYRILEKKRWTQN